MCDTCPSHIPGPAEVGAGVLGAAVGAAMSPAGRKILFWTICVPVLPFALWGELGWLGCSLIAGLAVVLTGAGLVFMRRMHRHVLVVAPPSLQHRVALPAARPRRAAALPRNLAITRKRPRALPAAAARPAQALPAAQRALEGVVVSPPARTARPRP